MTRLTSEKFSILCISRTKQNEPDSAIVLDFFECYPKWAPRLSGAVDAAACVTQHGFPFSVIVIPNPFDG